MSKNFDLKDRTKKFGIEIIIFCQKIPKNTINLPLISQLIRSGTSIGANYFEADNAESKNDFKHKIGISKKESDETVYWLDLISITLPKYKDEIQKLRQEAKELNLIFNSISKKC
jgi:four helix bundle protein